MLKIKIIGPTGQLDLAETLARNEGNVEHDQNHSKLYGSHRKLILIYNSTINWETMK